MEHKASSKPALLEGTKPSKAPLAVIADWLIIFGEVYREEVTEILAVAYRIALEDLRPKLLHKAFLRAMKQSRFRPTPAEVREAAAVERQNEPPSRPQLVAPQLSAEERAKALEDPEYQARKARITLSTPDIFRREDGSHTAQCLCRQCRARRNRQ